MITRKELIQKAKLIGIPPSTVDKDYVLGHFLNALFSYEWAQSNLVFKGGTCLKKCYFENYRYSEDIDITLRDSRIVFPKNWLKNVCKKVDEISGIALNILKEETVFHNNKEVGLDIEICYWGSDHNPNEAPIFRKECHTKIILEIRHFEIILLPVIQCKILHLYSDAMQINSLIPCYSIEEILSEKLRALIQRNRGEARDYFDIWYIHKNMQNINWKIVKDAFLKKCEFKQITFVSQDQFFIEERIDQVKITWEKRLQHQLPFNVDKDLVLEELHEILKAIF
jgi:predicted nucleotidyltransferase component of viral defense system